MCAAIDGLSLPVLILSASFYLVLFCCKIRESISVWQECCSESQKRRNIEMTEFINNSITLLDVLFPNTRREIISILCLFLLFFFLSDKSPAFHLLDSWQTPGDFKRTFNGLLFSALGVRCLGKEGPRVPPGLPLMIWFMCTGCPVTSGRSPNDPNNHFASAHLY